MNVKSIVVLCLMFICFLISWRWYTCKIKNFCNGSNNSIVEEVDIVEVSFPVLFYPNTDSPILDNFNAFKDSLCNVSQNEKIDLIGYYGEDETNSTSFENLGLARANKLKDLMSDCLNQNNVNLVAQKSSSLEHIGDYVLASAVGVSQAFDANSSDAQMITHDGVTDIVFPSGSANEIKSEKVDNYLKGVAENSKDKKIYLTGYTDNTGSEGINKRISLERAEAIKKQLVALGVPAENIITAGLGPENPRGDNSTDEGRAMNRRVEVKVE